MSGSTFNIDGIEKRMSLITAEDLADLNVFMKRLSERFELGQIRRLTFENDNDEIDIVKDCDLDGIKSLSKAKINALKFNIYTDKFKQAVDELSSNDEEYQRLEEQVKNLKIKNRTKSMRVPDSFKFAGGINENISLFKRKYMNFIRYNDLSATEQLALIVNGKIFNESAYDFVTLNLYQLEHINSAEEKINKLWALVMEKYKQASKYYELKKELYCLNEQTAGSVKEYYDLYKAKLEILKLEIVSSDGRHVIPGDMELAEKFIDGLGRGHKVEIIKDVIQKTGTDCIKFKDLKKYIANIIIAESRSKIISKGIYNLDIARRSADNNIRPINTSQYNGPINSNRPQGITNSNRPQSIDNHRPYHQRSRSEPRRGDPRNNDNRNNRYNNYNDYDGSYNDFDYKKRKEFRAKRDCFHGRNCYYGSLCEFRHSSDDKNYFKTVNFKNFLKEKGQWTQYLDTKANRDRELRNAEPRSYSEPRSTNAPAEIAAVTGIVNERPSSDNFDDDDETLHF